MTPPPEVCIEEFANVVGADRLAMLAAYFDESGTHSGSNVVAVGGWVADTKVWAKFTKKWTKHIRAAGVTHYHATDLESLQGEYRGWSVERKQAFQRTILKDLSVLDGVSCGVPVAAYERLLPHGSFLRNMYGSPYCFCAAQCVVRLIEIAKRDGYVQPIAVTFEDGGPTPGFLLELLRDQREHTPMLGTVAFGSKFQHPQLQAADFHAYEAWKHFENRIVDGEKRPVRKSLYAMLKPYRRIGGWFVHPQGLEGFVKQTDEILARGETVSASPVEGSDD